VTVKQGGKSYHVKPTKYNTREGAQDKSGFEHGRCEFRNERFGDDNRPNSQGGVIEGKPRHRRNPIDED